MNTTPPCLIRPAPARQHGKIRQLLTVSFLCCLIPLFQANSHAQAAEDADTDVARQNLKVITDDWADLLKSFKESDSLDNIIHDFQRHLDNNGRSITSLPDSNPMKAEMLTVLENIKKEFPLKAKAAQGALEARHLKEVWERDSAEGEGWEKESPASFSAMLKQQSEAMSSLGMPKTAAMHMESAKFLESTKPATDDAAVKSLLGGITKTRDATRARLVKAANAILDEAGKTTLTQDSRSRLERFGEDDLRLALGSSPETKALQTRAATMVAAFDKAAGGAKAEVDKLSGDLNEKASAMWPALAGKVKTTGDFDAAAALKNPGNFEGRYFLLSEVANRLGWDFKPGDYDFAFRKNGTAVVGRYDASVRAVLEETKKRLNLDDLPEEDYDIIAEVAGTAKATVFQNVEGEVKVDGTSDRLKLSGRREVSEDAVLLHIIGLHAGPVAVVAGGGRGAGGWDDQRGGRAAGNLFCGRKRRLLQPAALVPHWNCRRVAGAAESGLPRAGGRGSVAKGSAVARGFWNDQCRTGVSCRGRVVSGARIVRSWAVLLAGVHFRRAVSGAGFLHRAQLDPGHVADKVRGPGIAAGLAVCVISVLHLLLGGSIGVL